MANQLFHIFRNNPQGRETLLQSLYFCKAVTASLVIYIPKHKKLLLDFKNGSVRIDLDRSYFTAPETAVQHAVELTKKMDVTAEFLEIENYSNSKPPDIKPEFDFMCCPSCISDRCPKIGAGQVGPKVNQIMNFAHFPIFLTKPAFKKWQSIAVFLRGSANDENALKLGLRINSVSGFPIDAFLFEKNNSQKSYETVIGKNNSSGAVDSNEIKWHHCENGSFAEHFYEVPHNALVVLGASDHMGLKNIFFGNRIGRAHAELPNNLLIAGPHCI